MTKPKVLVRDILTELQFQSLDGRAAKKSESDDSEEFSDLLSLLFKQRPAALLEVNFFNDTFLHILCRHGAPHAIIEKVVQSEPIATLLVNCNQNTALHLALKASLPVETIELIMDTCPDIESVLRKSNRIGNTPIHYAFKYADPRAFGPIQRRMIVDCPQALASTNWQGDTPLHTACKHLYGASINNECLDGDSNYLTLFLMMRADATSIGIKNFDGQTPLHLAFLHGIPTIVISLMLELIDPLALCEADTDEGYTPLHYAFGSISKLGAAEHILVRQMIKACPRALRIVSKKRDLPLHLACRRNDVPTSLIQEMIDFYPDSLQLSTQYRGTALHLACGMIDKEDEYLDFHLNLARKWPLACLSLDAIKRLPCEYYCQQRETDDILNVTRDATCALIEFAFLLQDSSSAGSQRAKLSKTVLETVEAFLFNLSCPSKNVDQAFRTKISYRFLHGELRQCMKIELLHSFLKCNSLQSLITRKFENQCEVESNGFDPLIAACQRLMFGLVRMHQSGRQYIHEDPCNTEKAIQTFASVADNLDCLFLHLRESPFLCVRS